MPTVHIEFYGVPRLKAGVDSLQVEAASVADVFAAMQTANPAFSDGCLTDGQLAKEYLLNINGKEFTRDASVQLEEGDVVLILSADVGG